MKKKKKVGLATQIFVAVFSIYAAFTLVSLQLEINAKRRERDDLNSQLEAQQVVNAELESLLSADRDERYIAKIARENLDYILPGEKVFVNISSK